jgi:hypothetical protein
MPSLDKSQRFLYIKQYLSLLQSEVHLPRNNLIFTMLDNIHPLLGNDFQSFSYFILIKRL